METKFVFLDSTEFVSNAFNFESKKLVSLRNRGADSSICILTTNVVLEEVVNRIARHAEEAHNETRKLVSSEKFRTIRHLIPDTIANLEAIAFDDLKAISRKQLDDYINAANIKIISADDVRAGEVLALYFGKLPPFGEGKKKAEFPDAISLTALKAWCEDTGEKVYVVSKDKDVGKLSVITDSFIAVNDLSEFLNVVTEKEQHDQNEQLMQEDFVRDFTERFEKEIRTEIAKIFSEHEVVTPNYDINAEFENLEVVDVSVLSAYVINADAERIVVDVKANVIFRADVDHLDYDTAAYDREDGKYIFINNTDYRFESESIQQGTLEFQILSTPPESWADVNLDYHSLEPSLIELDLDEVDIVGKRSF